MKRVMSGHTQIKIFEEKKVRTIWDAEKEDWYFSVVDVVAVLTESDRPRKYWNDLKKKLQQEGSELSEEIGQLKMPSSDGKMYKTDCMNTEQLFRLSQSIPSPKAEPFKLWMAQVAKNASLANMLVVLLPSLQKIGRLQKRNFLTIYNVYDIFLAWGMRLNFMKQKMGEYLLMIL